VTADPTAGTGSVDAGPVRVDVLLLAGQFPGMTHAQALGNAMAYALAAEQAVSHRDPVALGRRGARAGRAVWLSGTETVGADGEFFRFPPVAVVPTARRPVPVWVAATGASTAALAATRALPLLLGMHATTADKRALLDDYHAHATIVPPAYPYPMPARTSPTSPIPSPRLRTPCAPRCRTGFCPFQALPGIAADSS